MYKFFSTFCEFQIKAYFLSLLDAIIILLDLTINIRSTVVKNGIFQSVSIVYFKELTCQNRQCVHRSWVF